MAKTMSDRALMALLALESDDPKSSATKKHAPDVSPLPTLDERVDLFLRAIHGSQRKFTAKERIEARNRILHAMAADLAGQAEGENFAEDIGRQAAAAPRRADTKKTGTVGLALSNLGEVLREALLFPLSGGPMRLVTASLAALLVTGGAWSATWFYAAHTAQTTIASFVDWEAKSGRVYDCGSRTIGGFPLRVELNCLDPKATLASGSSALIANAKELRTVVSLLQPSVLTTEVTGPISISGAGQAYVGNWTLAQTTLRATAASPEQVSVLFEDLQFYRVTQISMEPLLTTDRLQFNTRPNPAAAADKSIFDITAQVTGGSIPTGGSIVSKPFDAEIMTTLQNVHHAAPKTWPALLRDWQASGGRLAVTKAQFQQGDSIATASGIIGLTTAGRIEGNLRVATAGAYVQLAQSFIRDEPDGAAQREKIAQSMLGGSNTRSRSVGDVQRTEVELRREAAEREARARAERERPQAERPAQPLEISIRFTDGAAYLGTARLGEIPPLF